MNDAVEVWVWKYPLGGEIHHVLEIILRGGVNQYYHLNKTFSFP